MAQILFPFILRLESVACNVILRILDEETVGQKRCISQCTAKKKIARKKYEARNLRIPPSCGDHSTQMPKAMRVDQSMPRGKVK